LLTPPPLRAGSSRLIRLIRHIFKDYIFKQHQRKPAFCIDVKLDEEILPQSKALGAYFDLFPFLFGSAGFVKKNIGEAVVGDFNHFLRELADFYSDTGFIFDNAPTMFRNRISGQWPLKILHFFDRPRNFFPSLHVILASYVFFETSRLLDKYPAGFLSSFEIKEGLFKRSVRIIESCLLTKQHGIRDIAGGLALVSIREPEFEQTAGMIIRAMFTGGPFMLLEPVSGLLRQEMEKIYTEIMDQITIGRSVACSHPESIVNYIQSRTALEKV